MPTLIVSLLFLLLAAFSCNANLPQGPYGPKICGSNRYDLSCVLRTRTRNSSPLGQRANEARQRRGGATLVRLSRLRRNYRASSRARRRIPRRLLIRGTDLEGRSSHSTDEHRRRSKQPQAVLLHGPNRLRSFEDG